MLLFFFIRSAAPTQVQMLLVCRGKPRAKSRDSLSPSCSGPKEPPQLTLAKGLSPHCPVAGTSAYTGQGLADLAESGNVSRGTREI